MPDFNGDTLIITLDSGVTTINVEADLYSAWKEWLLESPNNRKYPQAFRTVGGDPLTPGINAGAYFFIQNDKGWRIKPFEADATVFVVGNLAAEDSSLPILVPTDGDFSVLVAGLQPITQSVEDILLQNQTIQYGGAVYVDLLNGFSGTDYPTGLQSRPVNNVIDAFTIAANVGAKTFQIVNGTFILDRDAESYIFIDAGSGSVDVTGYDVGGSQFLGVSLIGTSFSATTSSVRVVGSQMTNVSDFRGLANQCKLSGTISLQPVLSNFSYCSSLSGEIQPFFNAQNGAVQLNVTDYSGHFNLVNATNAFFRGTLDCSSAEINIDSSNTAGILEIRGIGSLDDQSAGLNLIRTGFIEGDDVIQLREYIYIDKVDGVNGTTENIGTSINPVNNIQDAYTLSVKRNTRKFRIRTVRNNINPIVLDRTFSGYTFEGVSGKFNAVIDLNGQNVDEAVFTNVSLRGTGTGDIFGNGLDVINITGITGLIRNSGIEGFSFTGNDQSLTLIDCYSSVAGNGFPPIYMNGYSGLTLEVRGYKGSLGLYGSTSSSNAISFDTESGRLILDASNTAGDLIARGVGTIQDDSTGIIIDKTGFVDARLLEELHRLQGLDLDNPMTVTPNSRVAGDINLTITGDGQTSSTVTRNP